MRINSRVERQLRLLSEPRNRAILELLEESGEPIAVRELADRLASRKATIVRSEAYDEQIDRICIDLHHKRLPQLVEASLVEYDRESNLASTPPQTGFDEALQEGTDLEDVIRNLPDYRNDTVGMGIIAGRGSIIDYECRLADDAEEEIFSMYVSTDLLGEDFIDRAKDAQDRGVTLCVGSRSEAVREVTREHLPDATVWEPQLDWMYARSYPLVSRLVLVDRRRVVLAVVSEPPSEETSADETALVGNGVENPLVVLVRELLGQRLDHLDYQSERFQSAFSSHR